MKQKSVPELRPVNSSVATHAGYDPHSQTLVVTFMNGKTFSYEGVPVDKAETLMGSASFGRTLNQLILGRHQGKVIAGGSR